MTRPLVLVASLLMSGLPHTTAAAQSEVLYQKSCIACHGPKAKGAIPGVPDLAKDGRLAKSNASLVANILDGIRSKGSPMAMPPKGGNPTLTAADAQALVTYIRRIAGPTK